MARKQNFWIGQLSNFIRRNPKTSASIAFNLGVFAALATRRGLAKSDLHLLPAKAIDLVPSMKDIGAYVPSFVPSFAAAKPKPASKPRRRKTAAKTATRAARRRATKRRG
ncbi:MAG: hypothetical protein ACR2K5_16785 [Pseudolabrys sp.]